MPTPTQIADLRSLWSAGHSPHNIGLLLDRSPATVTTWARRLGLPGRRQSAPTPPGPSLNHFHAERTYYCAPAHPEPPPDFIVSVCGCGVTFVTGPVERWRAADCSMCRAAFVESVMAGRRAAT